MMGAVRVAMTDARSRGRLLYFPSHDLCMEGNLELLGASGGPVPSVAKD